MGHFRPCALFPLIFRGIEGVYSSEQKDDACSGTRGYEEKVRTLAWMGFILADRRLDKRSAIHVFDDDDYGDPYNRYQESYPRE